MPPVYGDVLSTWHSPAWMRAEPAAWNTANAAARSYGVLEVGGQDAHRSGPFAQGGR